MVRIVSPQEVLAVALRPNGVLHLAQRTGRAAVADKTFCGLSTRTEDTDLFLGVLVIDTNPTTRCCDTCKWVVKEQRMSSVEVSA